MRQTSKLNLNLIDGGDTLSPKAINDNTEKIGEELDYHSNGVQIRQAGGGDPVYTQVGTVDLATKAEGDVIQLVESGKLVDFVVAKLNYEAATNGEGRTLVVRCGPTADAISNRYESAFPGAIGQFLDTTYYGRLGRAVQRAALSTTISYNSAPWGESQSHVQTVQKKVFPLSATELGLNEAAAVVLGAELPTAEQVLSYFAAGQDAWLRSNGQDVVPYAGGGTTYVPAMGRVYRDSNDILRGDYVHVYTTANEYPAGALPAIALPADFTYGLYVDENVVYYDEQLYGVNRLEAYGYRSDAPLGFVGNASVVFGSYVGDGTYGAAVGRTITFPVIPKAWGFYAYPHGAYQSGSGVSLFPWGVDGTVSDSMELHCTVKYEGNSVTLTGGGDASRQANTAGATYYYWALY